MKNLNKVFLTALIISCSTTYGQIYTPGATIAGPSGSSFVGIGISSPTSKLHVFDLSSSGSVDLQTNYLFFGNNNNIFNSGLCGTFGASNFIDQSKTSFDFGRKNSIVNSASSFTSGTQNSINESEHSMAFGFSNKLETDVSTGAIGDNNRVTKSESSVAFGRENDLEKDLASGTIGQENRIINSTASTAFGKENFIESSTLVSAVGGKNHIISSDQSVALGEDNKIIDNCHGCAAIGGHNTIDGLGGSKYQFTIGAGLMNNIPGSVMIGTSSSVPTLFVGGNNRVGIGGLTTPAEALDVIGSIQASSLAPGGQVCADANGKLYISGPCGSGGGDDLGNHQASMNLNMNCFEIDKVSNINFCNGIVFNEQLVPGELVIQGGPVGIGISPSSVGTSPLGSSAMLAVAGSIWANGFWYSSDERFKQNIQKMPNALETIKRLNGYSYEYRTTEFPDYNFQQGETYGFLAQEVEQISPSLVQKGENGYYSVNYLGVIPILTEAIKEQQSLIEAKNAEIENLEDHLADIENELHAIRNEVNSICMNGCGTITPNDNSQNGSIKVAKLDKNIPNPFSGRTSIGYFVPSHANSAYITITDLSGKQLEQYELGNYGTHSQLVITTNEKLVAGIYLYNLIVDNELIDSKKMVISNH